MLLIGSPMCQTFCGVITTMMPNANRVSEVKYKNFVEQCDRHLEEKEMCQVPGNAGRLFLHENLWDRWSRGLSFVKEVAESDGVHTTNSELCRSQSTLCSPRRGSCFKSKSEYVTEELGMCCCNKVKRTKIHVKNVLLMVYRGLKRENDSVKAIGSKEVGRAIEESNAMDSISVVEFDTRLLRESRQMEIDFVNQLDVYYRHPRQWASFVGMTGMLEARQLEYRSRLCEKGLKRSGSDVECAMLGASPRKIRSLDASGARRMAGVASGVAIEPQPDEQVVCRDVIGELSNSLSEMGKETRSWKTKWRHVFVNHKPKSSTVVCCHERELCGLVHRDDFIVTGDSVQLMWIGSRLKEGLNFERCADRGVDDGIDKMVTILNRLVTLACVDEYGRIRHLHRPMPWLRGADRHIKKFDCTNESAVQEIRERRDPGVHSRLHRRIVRRKRVR